MQVKQSKSGVVKGCAGRASAALLRARARHARRARARARVMELEGAAEAKGAALIFSCCWGLLTSVSKYFFESPLSKPRRPIMVHHQPFFGACFVGLSARQIVSQRA